MISEVRNSEELLVHTARSIQPANKCTSYDQYPSPTLSLAAHALPCICLADGRRVLRCNVFGLHTEENSPIERRSTRSAGVAESRLLSNPLRLTAPVPDDQAVKRDYATSLCRDDHRVEVHLLQRPPVLVSELRDANQGRDQSLDVHFRAASRPR